MNKHTGLIFFGYASQNFCVSLTKRSPLARVVDECCLKWGWGGGKFCWSYCE